MAVATIELRRYVTAQGISPFGVWLRELGDAKLRAWIEVRLKRIGAVSWAIGGPLGKVSSNFVWISVRVIASMPAGMAPA
ncbi:hypothetical protein ACOTFF_07270 [Achromobacter xylosoxidans]